MVLRHLLVALKAVDNIEEFRLVLRNVRRIETRRLRCSFCAFDLHKFSLRNLVTMACWRKVCAMAASLPLVPEINNVGNERIT